jgi:hypothetical protein
MSCSDVQVLTFFSALLASMRGSRAFREAATLFLRQQPLVLRRSAPAKLRLRNTDRLIFVWLYRLFPSLFDAAVLSKPEPLVCWHRGRLHLFWRWKSNRRAGCPAVSSDIRESVRPLNRKNSRRGAPSVHSELLKLGILPVPMMGDLRHQYVRMA